MGLNNDYVHDWTILESTFSFPLISSAVWNSYSITILFQSFLVSFFLTRLLFFPLFLSFFYSFPVAIFFNRSHLWSLFITLLARAIFSPFFLFLTFLIVDLTFLLSLLLSLFISFYLSFSLSNSLSFFSLIFSAESHFFQFRCVKRIQKEARLFKQSFLQQKNSTRSTVSAISHSTWISDWNTLKVKLKRGSGRSPRIRAKVAMETFLTLRIKKIIRRVWWIQKEGKKINSKG